MGEDRPCGQAELIDGEVPARQGQVRAAEMAPDRELPLPELQGGQNEQVGPLVVTAVERANPVDDLVRELELVHACKDETVATAQQVPPSRFAIEGKRRR